MRPAGCARYEDELALLAGGDLSGDDATALRAHLSGCTGCAVTLEEMRAALSWARQSDDAPFGEADLELLQRRVMTVVVDRPPPAVPLFQRLLRLMPSGGLGLALAGATAAIVVAAVVGTREQPPTVVHHLVAPAADQPAQVAPEEAAPDSTAGDDLWAALAEPAEPGPQMKIELRTNDPKIRILWLAQR